MKCGSYHIWYLIAVSVQIPLMTVLMRFLMKFKERYRSDEETVSVWVLNHIFDVWQNLNPTRGRDFSFQRNTYPITVMVITAVCILFFEITLVIKIVVIVVFEETFWMYSKGVSVFYTPIPCGFLLELEDYFSTLFSTTYWKGTIQFKRKTAVYIFNTIITVVLQMLHK